MKEMEMSIGEWVAPRKDEDLRALAHEMHDGLIFHDNLVKHLPTEEMLNTLRLVFLPLAAGMLPEKALVQAGLLFEYREKAKKTVRGFPVFESVQAVHVDDMAKLTAFTKEYAEAKKKESGES